MAGMEQGRIIFRNRNPGERQRRKVEALQTHKILATKYVDEDCMDSLGICHRVVYMLDNLKWHDIFFRREPTFEYLT